MPILLLGPSIKLTRYAEFYNTQIDEMPLNVACVNIVFYKLSQPDVALQGPHLTQDLLLARHDVLRHTYSFDGYVS